MPSGAQALVQSELFSVLSRIPEIAGIRELAAQACAAHSGQRREALALAAALTKSLPCPRGVGGLALVDYWRHGWATGVVMEAIAARGDLPPGLALVAGLVHDVGKLILAAVLAPKYETCVTQALQNRGLIFQAERLCLGLDHTVVGSCALRIWGFPTVVATGVEAHHRPRRLNPLPTMARAIQVADAIAHAAGLGAGEWPMPTAVSSLADPLIPLTEEQVVQHLLALQRCSSQCQEFAEVVAAACEG